MSQEVAQRRHDTDRATAARRLGRGGEVIGTDGVANGHSLSEVQSAEIKRPERRESAC